MPIRATVTLGICLGAGLAAGIGLARPGLLAENTPVPAPAAAAATGTPTAPASPGYGRPTTSAPAGANPAGAALAPAAADPVTIQDFAFAGGGTVVPGAAVPVVNADSVAHTLTADDRSFDTGTLESGGRATITAPTAPGTFRFLCAIHPSMQGTLTVAP
ncbi:MAG: cupredoxin domain-containing protein [Acidimicrobiia bacterium]|nr:cupredoxin domain-containing protein [Acidimicrobiia bacterium]